MMFLSQEKEEFRVKGNNGYTNAWNLCPNRFFPHRIRKRLLRIEEKVPPQGNLARNAYSPFSWDEFLSRLKQWFLVQGLQGGDATPIIWITTPSNIYAHTGCARQVKLPAPQAPRRDQASSGRRPRERGRRKFFREFPPPEICEMLECTPKKLPDRFFEMFGGKKLLNPGDMLFLKVIVGKFLEAAVKRNFSPSGQVRNESLVAILDDVFEAVTNTDMDIPICRGYTLKDLFPKAGDKLRKFQNLYSIKVFLTEMVVHGPNMANNSEIKDQKRRRIWKKVVMSFSAMLRNAGWYNGMGQGGVEQPKYGPPPTGPFLVDTPPNLSAASQREENEDEDQRRLKIQGLIEDLDKVRRDLQSGELSSKTRQAVANLMSESYFVEEVWRFWYTMRALYFKKKARYLGQRASQLKDEDVQDPEVLKKLNEWRDKLLQSDAEATEENFAHFRTNIDHEFNTESGVERIMGANNVP